MGRCLRQGCRSGHPGGTDGAWPALQVRALRAYLSVLLALRHAAALLRQRDLVHPHQRLSRPTGESQPGDQLVSGPHQGRTLRQMAGEQCRLGVGPRSLLGHAAAHLGQRRARQHLRRVHWFSGRAVGEGRPRSDWNWTCIVPTWTN
jgi:hypothetical protein